MQLDAHPTGELSVVRVTTRHQIQALLGHSAATTTDGYIRRQVGEKVQPIEIAGKPQNFAGNDSDEFR
jgi:hypothetical protein